MSKPTKPVRVPCANCGTLVKDDGGQLCYGCGLIVCEKCSDPDYTTCGKHGIAMHVAARERYDEAEARGER